MRFYETFLKLFTAFYIFTQSGLLAEQIGDLVYSVDQELVTITDYIGPTVDELIVPVTIDGKKVVSIGPNAFADAFIQKLILPDGLERIMESAFDSSYIEQLEIPASVTFIDSTALARVVYPSISVSEENQIYTINDGVLFDKEVTQILTYFRRGYLDYKIPSTVVSFDFAVIKNDSDLETLEIPASVVTISNLEGYTERYLKHIVVDPENTNYTSLDGVLYSKDTSQLILWPVRKSVVGYTFPLEITSIGEEAFLKVNNLGDFSIPESVQMIGARAFMDCRMLTSVTIPSGVTSIEDRTFYGCTELRNVNFPEGLLAIKHRAFGNCGSLDELILPEGFTTIEDFGLSGVGLRSVVSLPSTLQSIGTGGFWGCGFSQISIPESVEFIGEYPFGACLLLSHIYVDPQNGSFLSDEVGVLYDQEVKRLIAFPPENRIGFYKIPDTVEAIKAYSMRGNFMHEIVLPLGLMIIERSAFQQSHNLLSIEIPSEVSVIEEDAFRLSRVLSEVQFCGYVDEIQDRAFLDCEQLQRVNFKKSVVHIKGSVFERCGKLKEINFPEGLVEIGPGAFKNAGLVNVKFPRSLESIGDNAFEYLLNLETVIFQDGLTEIGAYAFFESGRIETLVLPGTIEIIGEGAFLECGEISTVTFPESLTLIRARAFELCYGIEKFYFTGDAPTVESDAFKFLNSTVYVFDSADGLQHLPGKSCLLSVLGILMKKLIGC